MLRDRACCCRKISTNTTTWRYFRLEHNRLFRFCFMKNILLVVGPLGSGGRWVAPSDLRLKPDRSSAVPKQQPKPLRTRTTAELGRLCVTYAGAIMFKPRLKENSQGTSRPPDTDHSHTDKQQVGEDSADTDNPAQTRQLLTHCCA